MSTTTFVNPVGPPSRLILVTVVNRIIVHICNQQEIGRIFDRLKKLPRQTVRPKLNSQIFLHMYFRF